jgi:PAS domain-containing protein
VRGIVGYLRVVTVKRGAQKGTREVEEALRTVFNSAHEGIFVSDLGGNIVHANGKVLDQ